MLTIGSPRPEHLLLKFWVVKHKAIAILSQASDKKEKVLSQLR